METENLGDLVAVQIGHNKAAPGMTIIISWLNVFVIRFHVCLKNSIYKWFYEFWNKFEIVRCIYSEWYVDFFKELSGYWYFLFQVVIGLWIKLKLRIWTKRKFTFLRTTIGFHTAKQPQSGWKNCHWAVSWTRIKQKVRTFWIQQSNFSGWHQWASYHQSEHYRYYSFQ